MQREEKESNIQDGHDIDTHVSSGTKPLLLFKGDTFTADAQMQRIQNLLIDFFRCV